MGETCFSHVELSLAENPLTEPEFDDFIDQQLKEIQSATGVVLTVYATDAKGYWRGDQPSKAERVKLLTVRFDPTSVGPFTAGINAVEVFKARLKANFKCSVVPLFYLDARYSSC
jgi:hypothetical protein